MVTTSDFKAVLGNVAAGDARASYVEVVGRKCLEFVDALTTDDFSAMGKQLVRIVTDPKTAPRTKLRAAEAVLKQLPRSIEILKITKGEIVPVVADHIQKYLHAFLEGLGDGGVKRMATELLDLALPPGSKGYATAVRASSALLKLGGDIAKVLDEFAQSPPLPRYIVDPSDPKVIETEAYLRAMEKEILEKGGPGYRLPDPISEPPVRDDGYDLDLLEKLDAEDRAAAADPADN
ncbi:MAG: hypothetical protein KAY37_10475 [Phycisphaerae bacterium]|nr:hypothetical protein [Phycisphaerae bacterium]